MENMSVDGVRSAAIESGIRYANRLDLVLIELADTTKTAGVFTLNAFCAAPVPDCQIAVLGLEGEW